MKITLTAKSEKGEKTEHIMELPPETGKTKKVVVVLNRNEKVYDVVSEVFNGTVRQAVDKYAKEHREQMDDGEEKPMSMKDARYFINDMYHFELVTITEKGE